MDYANTFLELVTNKEKLFQNHSIIVSLGEIADIWNRKNLVLEVKNIPPAFGKAEYIDHAFLEDVILVLANLQKENLVVFVG
jgi:hypothetical protein